MPLLKNLRSYSCSDKISHHTNISEELDVPEKLTGPELGAPISWSEYSQRERGPVLSVCSAGIFVEGV